MEKQEIVNNFSHLKVSPKIVEVLKKAGYLRPTPIQNQAIPPALRGKDVIGIAQTGTGKTLAFGIPIIQLLAERGNNHSSLIVLPTRELTIQIDKEIKKIGKPFGLGTAVLIGGDPIDRQIASLKTNPRIIIATPGRLIDHLRRKTVVLKQVSILVLDEVDRMVDMGFLPQVKRILEAVPEKRQTMIFSATVSSTVIGLTSKYMNSPVRAETSSAGTTVEKVFQEIFVVREEAKNKLIKRILGKYSGPILVFTNTKYRAGRLAASIRQMGYSAAEMHADRNLSQRKAALEGFRQGKYQVLVATDVVARGIDIAGIELVLNYDLPAQAEDYVHRIGRTARAGKTGKAISLVRPSEQKEVRAIEWLIKKKLNVAEDPENLSNDFAKPRLVYSSRKRQRGKLG